MVSYWRLGESSGATAADEKGANPGSYLGGPTLGEPGALNGDPNTAVRFDGVNDEVSLPGPALSTQGSIEGWFYWESGLVMRDSTRSGGWVLAFDSGGQLAYRVGGTTFVTGRSTASVRNGWHHLVLTRSAGSTAFYVDGALVHQGSGAGSAAAKLSWHLMRNGLTSGQFSRGRADELAIYDTALPAQTVQQHYDVGTSPATAAGPCTKVASPLGQDTLPGSELLPFRTAQKLADSLHAGDVGCLRTGTYTEDVELRNAGTGSAPITLQSYPGERARIVGELAVRAGAHYTTVANLDLNGRNPGNWPGPAISADHVTFKGNDVTNDNTLICFLIGTATRARFTVIKDNRIHDCGKLPATNLHEGIYVQHADDTQILDNFIYDNADMGIQLYPDAQRTLIKGNVIDGNGEGILFSGGFGLVSNDNVVENNVITNSRIRWNVESYYDPGAPVGERNVVRNNCVHGGANDDGNGGIAPQIGFTATGNIVADPSYVNRGAKDFRLAPSSPCAGILG